MSLRNAWSLPLPLGFRKFTFSAGEVVGAAGQVTPRTQPAPGKSPRQVVSHFLDATAPPSELLEICELSQEKMSSVFEDSNVYMLHMMYQAMGVCLYMQDWEGALRYGQKIIKPYR